VEPGTAVKLSSLIGGAPTSNHGREVALPDPATGEEAFRAELVTTRDVARAVAVACDAQPAWARTPAIARGVVLREAADVLEGRRDELAHRITGEMGKVLAESRAEVDEAAFYLRHMSGEGARLVGETRPSVDPRRLSIAERVPAGVVAAITPWNFPLCIPTWKIAAALVVGNGVVFKPALQTAGTGLALAEALSTAGLPAGALNVLVGTGEEAGEELARHPDVRVLTFTGSTAVGHRLAGLVGGRGARVGLELGGKNVAVVLGDADLEHAAERIAHGAFATAGQRCTATSRVIVDGDVHDELLGRLAECADDLRVGPGINPASDVGPLVSVESRQRVASAVAAAATNGARVVAGGYAPEELPGQAGYYRPTVVSGLRSTDALVRDELFGPVTAVLRADDEDEALRLANATDYGLAASIFTRDLGRALHFSRALRAGVVFVNAATVEAETHLPFGGMGASGNGSRDTGLAALETYTEWKTTYLAPPGTVLEPVASGQLAP